MWNDFTGSKTSKIKSELTFFFFKSFNKYNLEHDYTGYNATQKVEPSSVRPSNLLILFWL